LTQLRFYVPLDTKYVILPISWLGIEKLNLTQLEMWAQRDGRPAEYRWHSLFNAAKFG